MYFLIAYYGAQFPRTRKFTIYTKINNKTNLAPNVSQYHTYDGGFSIPIFLSFLTMNGTQVIVIPILTGVKTLWKAYAMTKVLAPVATDLLIVSSLTPIADNIAPTSKPLF
jgi:hypothetical protein